MFILHNNNVRELKYLLWHIYLVNLTFLLNILYFNLEDTLNRI